MSLGKDLYKKIKSGVTYDAEKHCSLIIDLFAKNEGLSEFCLAVGISRDTYVQWMRENEDFRKCASLAKDVGIASWMRLYTEFEPDEHTDKFNTVPWYSLYKKNFGEQNKVTVYLDPKANPIQQYAQVMQQATNGDFTATEIKLIMESINIGLRAHEVCNLQGQVDELKDGLKKMEERELEHSIAVNNPPQENKASLDS